MNNTFGRFSSKKNMELDLFGKQATASLTNRNSSLANVTILYPMKIPYNQRFSGVFREYEMGAPARIMLKVAKLQSPIFSKSFKHF